MNSDSPALFEPKIGFDAIRKMVEDLCLSPLGRSCALQMTFSADGAKIAGDLTQTEEMRAIVRFEDRFPAQDYYDMIPELHRIRIPGTFMETEQLSELKLSLTAIVRLLTFIEEKQETYPALFGLSAGKDGHGGGTAPMDMKPLMHGLTARVDRLIDEKSQVRDTASDELGKIRKRKSGLQASVESRIMQSFRAARQNGWTPDDAEVTIRNGRLVIPMVSAHKRRIQGFVHDESATGQTVYIEPADIFETNNEIRELEYAERREIVRILTEFATEIRPHTGEMIKAYLFLGTIDFLRAKALFALSVNAVRPLHLPSGLAPGLPEPDPCTLSWRQAVHPLLYLSHSRQNRSVVPLDIDLDHDRRILIISGPNAGGKSVCLKTVGLVQYMFQCGLLPPAREDSEFCVFRRIFIDIGDEQSIDNDLSTYSSRLVSLKDLLEKVDNRSLFLIDEMGSGTDPSLGGAIAEAILEALNARSAVGVVTTHYSNLKLLAAREPGIVNGAMLYDLKKLKPLYQLRAGKPGSSFAFEIAREIGFPEDILKKAQQKTGRSQLDFDRELQNLEVEKQQIELKNTELRVADDFLAELIARYEKQSADLQSKKQEILQKARDEARNILESSNRIIEKTIREIREAQAEKEKTRDIRTDFEKERRKLLNTAEASPQGKEESEKPAPGNLKTPTPPPAVSRDLVGSKAPHRFQKYFDDLNARLSTFSLTLDLRGYRVEEAVPVLQRYIDDAVLFSVGEVRILHGKGNGVLRQVTRDYLRSQKEVKSARDAPVESGGAGITVVSFR